MSAAEPAFDLPATEVAQIVAGLGLPATSAELRSCLVRHPQLASPDGVRALQQSGRSLIGVEPRRSLVVAELIELAASDLGEAEQLLAQRARAQALWGLARYSESASLHLDVAASHRRRGDSAAAASAAMAAIESLAYVGRIDAAIDAAATARAGYRQVGDRVGEAKVDLNLGIVWHRLDRGTEALRCLRRARAVFHRRGDRLMVAIIDQNRALVHSLQGRAGQARELFAAARRTFVAAGQDVHGAVVDYNLAYDLFLGGEYDQAFAAMEEVRVRFEGLGHPYLVALAELDLAEMALALGAMATAGGWARSARQRLTALGLALDQGRAGCIEAAAAAGRGEPGDAIRLLEDAIALFRRDGHQVRAALAVVELGSLLVETDPDRAATEVRAARAELEQAGFRNASVRAKLIEGLASMATPQIARELLASAAASARRRRVPDVQWQCLSALARLDFAAGDRTAARRRIEQATAGLDRMRCDVRRVDLQGWLLGGRLHVYEQAMTVWLDGEVGPEAAEAALAYAERARSRVLADAVAAAGYGHGRSGSAPRTEPARVERLRRRLDRRYRQLLHRHRGAVVADPILAEIDALEADLEQALGPRRLTITARSEAVAPSSLRQALGRDGRLLEYQWVGSELWAFLVDADRVVARRLPASRQEIAAACADLAYQIAKLNLGEAYLERHLDALRRAMDRQLDRLGAHLIAPVADFVLGQAVTVVPTGDLHQLPFPALRHGGRYLVESSTVTIAPSATVWAMLASRPTVGRKSPLVVGVGDAGIPAAIDEARAVAADLPASRSLIGPAATVAAVKRQLPGRRIVHIATHGLYRPERPTQSSLLLADGWLSLHEIYGLRLDADLVTIAACQSGRSRVGAGDELVGLAQGFLFAGARSVLVSEWSVDDHSARRQMTDFYRLLRRGVPKAEALRKTMLAEMKRAPHPFYWAAFGLHGQA